MQMVKKITQLLTMMVIICGVGATVYAAELQKSNINFRNGEIEGDALLVINGRLSPYPPLLKDGLSFVPASAISDAFGVAIEWNEESGSLVIDGRTAELSAPALNINGSVYVPARAVAESLNCTLQFDQNVTAIPVVSIEQNKASVSSITEGEAAALVKANIATLFRLQYKNVKKSGDIDLFLNEVAYKAVSRSMGRFYRVEAHFYDQWSKRFESQAYVDMYTKQIFIGDVKYGLTDNILPYLVEKYENHLPLENNSTKVIPFSEMNILTDAPLVLVNFPEQIPGNALLETYYNRVEAISGSGRVFVSHKNSSKQTIDYITRFKNESDSETILSLIWDKGIHTTEEYQDQMIREHLARFYKNSTSGISEEIILQPGESYDAAIINIQDEQFFTAIWDFTASNNISATVFAVPSAVRDEEEAYKGIATPTIVFDYSYIPTAYVPIASDPENRIGDPYYTTYSGLGSGYRIAAGGTIRASQMLKPHASALGFNLAFETGGSVNNINHRNGLTEIVDIDLIEPRGANGEITKATWMGNIPPDGEGKNSDPNKARNYGNLGNWGIEYEITMQLINDTDTDKIFRCELVPVYQTTWTFIVDGNASTVNLNNRKYIDSFNRTIGAEYDQIHIGSGIKSGNAGGVIVKAGETREFSYTYVLGTECESNIFHIWTSIDG